TLVEGGADDGRPRAEARLAGGGLRASAAGVAGRTVGLVRGGAAAVRGVTGAGDVALIEGGADDGVRPDAGAGLAGVGLGAGIAVRAGAPVRLVRVGADAARRIAGARDVALIEGGADDGVRPRADARLAGVALRASAAVVAGRAVGLVWGGAGAARRITDAGDVALVERAADDRVRPRTGAGLAGVALRASVAVAAGGTVRLGGDGAGAAC